MPTELCYENDRSNAPVFAEVIVPRHLAKTFTYLVPPALVSRIRIGQRVVVPFGRTMLDGAVVGLTRDLPQGVSLVQLKAIDSLAEGNGLSGFPPGMFELSKKIAEEYLAPWGQCLRLVAPPARAAGQPKWCYVATPEGRVALAQGSCPDEYLPVLKRIARRKSGLSASTVESSRQALTFLQGRQWILKSAAAISRRSPRAGGDERESELPDPELFSCLSPDPVVVGRIQAMLHKAQSGRILIDGMLDYRVGLMARTARLALEEGRSVLIIIGEVVRAQWLAHVLREGLQLPATFQLRGASGVDGESDEGASPRIVVGTRSAIFSPLQSLGLIWVDGEEDSALKEPQEPHYHVRDVAWMRAQQESALLVYGSAHPSLEVISGGEIERFSQRREADSYPSVDLVDMSREFGGLPFSERLLTALRSFQAQHDRAILFLNRRGYAGALVCRDCGWVPRCRSCAVAFAYYRASARLACRYCGVREPLPETCGACGASRLSPIGEGTERIEQELRRLFPEARILRIDRDTLRGVVATRRLWGQVRARAWDILIGTQAMFQREPLPPVGLVGIVQADSGLHHPDFRAAERTHQLLVDAVNLARPASAGGRVILQTMLPTHHVMQAVSMHDPMRFYSEEMEARRLLGYPPVRHLTYLTVSGKDRRETELAAHRWVKELHQTLSPLAAETRPAGAVRGQVLPVHLMSSEISVLGPVAAVGVGPVGIHGWHIMVKGSDRAAMRSGVRFSLEAMERVYPRRTLKFSVDVDPVDMG